MSVDATVRITRRRPWAPGASFAAALFLSGVAAAALLASALAPHDPRAITGVPLRGPTPQHPLGTNDLGQDLLSIFVYGARVSLAVGFTAAALSTALSALVGILSVTWRPGRSALVALTDGFLTIPHLPVLVLIVALLGPGMWHLIATLTLLGWPAYARVVRAQVIVAVQRDYVEAARALAASEARIVWTCLVPEILPLVWTKLLLTVRWGILMEAALALMGLSDPTQISWGAMLNTAFSYPLLFAGRAWLWWATPPAAAIAVITLALSAIGQDFEAWLNPAAPRR